MTPRYTHRDVKWYPLQESEIASIGALGTAIAAFYNLATFFGSLAFGIYTNAIFYDHPNAAGLLARGFVAPVLIIVAIVFLALAISGNRKQSKIWADIQSSAAEIPVTET